MPRKKKSVPKRVAPKPPRPNTYERALATATKRIEKAQAEFNRCNERIAALNVEIPRLRSIINVLAQPSDIGRSTPSVARVLEVPKPMSPELAQYLAPPLDGVGSHPHNPEDDKFLPDV
jgi:hypothetical protein